MKPILSEHDQEDIDAALFALDWLLSLILRGDLVERSQYSKDTGELTWPEDLVTEVRQNTRRLRQRLAVDGPDVDKLLIEIDSGVEEATLKVMPGGRGLS